jgi:hypothetical protein
MVDKDGEIVRQSLKEISTTVVGKVAFSLRSMYIMSALSAFAALCTRQTCVIGVRTSLSLSLAVSYVIVRARLCWCCIGKAAMCGEVVMQSFNDLTEQGSELAEDDATEEAGGGQRAQDSAQVEFVNRQRQGNMGLICVPWVLGADLYEGLSVYAVHIGAACAVKAGPQCIAGCD